jgi:hypothetical protein
MKKIILFSILCCALTAQSQQVLNAGYDANLAKELQADDDGQRSYILCFLKSGSSSKITNKDEIANLKAEHLDFRSNLVKSGKAVFAVPIKANKTGFEEVYLLNVISQEDAEGIINDDPLVAAKLMVAEFSTMQASAALPMYVNYQDRIVKKKR